ncbi:MAG TPA: response regulator [Candidatus Limnocylindrales bacterium]|nr:response regulator [Candidatus Limnocylindrales bacterium]
MAAPVLLVEDDASLRGILARYLRGRGLRIEEAASVEDALEAIEHGVRPGLVLLDVNLPGDNGWDLLRSGRLRAAGNPPVIVTSAVPVSPKKLAEFDVAGYLPKPCPLDAIVDTIERLLGEAAGRPA